MELKRAKKSDCDLFFEWVNDDEVRKNSFSTDKVDYDKHISWFFNKIHSDCCIIYVAHVKQIPIGQIRVDIENDTGVIGYSIGKEFRGKGYGTLLLIKLLEVFKKENLNISRLIGRVKHDNISSRKAFERAGFSGVGYEEYVEYVKML